MKTKLFFLFWQLLFLFSLTANAQFEIFNRDKIHMFVSAVSTDGLGVPWGNRDYFLKSGIGHRAYDYSLGGNPEYLWEWDGDDIQYTPNTPIGHTTLFEINLRTFPSYLTLSVNEYIKYFPGYETNAWREVSFPLTYNYTFSNDYVGTFNMVLGRFTTIPTNDPSVKAGSDPPDNSSAPADEVFDSDGFRFSVTVLIPQIPITGFDTYDTIPRTVKMDRFCYGEPIYADTHFKDENRTITNTHFQYEYKMRGKAPIVVNQDLTLSPERLATGEIEIPTDLSVPDDRNDTVSVWLRVRMVGPNHGGVDGLHGPWSPAKKLLIYPPPPTVSTAGLNPGAPLSKKEDLIEKNTIKTFEVHHVSCANDNTGQIVIRSLNKTSGYFFSIKNLSNNEVMNYSALRVPDATNPITLPQDAFSDPSHANPPFRFKAGNYELKIQAIDPVTHAPFGCFSTQQFTIKQPVIFQANVSKLKYHNFDVSCSDPVTGLPGADGRIAVNPSGGIGPFDFTLKGYANGVEVTSQTLHAASNTVFTGLAARHNTVSIEYHLTGSDNATCMVNNLLQATHTYTKEYKPAPTPSEGALLTLLAPTPINLDLVDIDFQRYHNHNIRCFGWKDSTEVFITGGTHRYAAWVDGSGFSNYQRRDSVNENANQLIFSHLPAGTYTLHAVDRNGCSATKDFTFNQPAKLTTESSDVVLPDCFGNSTGSIRINGAGGVPLPGGQRYRYVMTAWPGNFNPGSTDKRGEEVMFTNLMKGGYSISIADTLGCKQTIPFTIAQPAALTANVTAEEIACYGDNSGHAEATIGGGIAPYTLHWIDAEKDVIVSEPQAQPGSHHTLENRFHGQYYVKLIDAHHCELEKPFIISQPPSPLVINAMTDETQHVSCNEAKDGKITLAVAGGWTLSPYEIGRSKDNLKPNAFAFTALDAGVQRFYVRDFEGCIDSVDVTLHEPDVLQATGIDIKAVSCFGKSDGSFATQITGGTVPYEINVNASGWTSANPVTGLVEGNYTLQARDANGCLSDFNVIIPTPAVLDVDLISSGDTQCGESNGHAAISISGGNTPYSIGWSLDDQPVTGTLTATALPSGVYKVMVTDTKNCQTSMNVGISDSDAAIITIADVTPITCFGDSDGTASITLTGGILPYTEILWTTGQTGLKATGLTASDYVVSVKDQAGCISTKQINIPGPDPLRATFKDVINPHCFGDDNGSVRVEASGGTAPYSYRWSNTSNSSDHMKDAGAGILSVGITDVNGCVLDTQYDLQQPPEVEVDLRGEAFFCTGQTVKLDAGNPGATYQWASTVGATSAARVLEATRTGTYTVTVTDARGCIGTGSRDLTFDSNILRADFISTSEAVAGDTVVFINVSFPLPDSSYWTLPEDVTVIEASYFIQYIIFPDSGIYTITLSATKGECFDQIHDNIIIHERKVKDDDDSGGRKATLITAFTIHPNPSSGKFKISVRLRETAPIGIKIFSYAGGNPWAVYQDADKESYEIDAEMNAPPGVYAIVLEAGNEKMVKRLIIY